MSESKYGRLYTTDDVQRRRTPSGPVGELRSALRHLQKKRKIVCSRVGVFEDRRELPPEIDDALASDEGYVLYVVAWHEDRWACMVVPDQLVRHSPTALVAGVLAKDLHLKLHGAKPR